MASSYVSIPVTRCTCRQIIGDLADSYQILVDSGIPKSDALMQLGVRNQCCARSLQSSTTYALQRARLGTKSLPKEDEKDELTHVLRFEGQRFQEGHNDAFLFALSKVNVDSRRIVSRKEPDEDTKDEPKPTITHSSSKKREQKRLLELFAKERRKKNGGISSMTPDEIIKDVIAKGPVEDIKEEEYDQQFMGSLKRGTVNPLGWAKDENGSVILVDVGEGYKVPYYQLYYSLAD